ncbi:MAG: hypothetical protein LBB45_06520 [Methanobrevibacter sp.]|nr:hypothetical protein [Candidatus Methanovirga basalitermitum]
MNIKYVEESVLNKNPLGLIKTRENRFKAIYPHETKSSEDLYIIIEITDNEEIIIITLYTTTIERRLRNYAI